MERPLEIYSNGGGNRQGHRPLQNEAAKFKGRPQENHSEDEGGEPEITGGDEKPTDPKRMCQSYDGQGGYQAKTGGSYDGSGEL